MAMETLLISVLDHNGICVHEIATQCRQYLTGHQSCFSERGFRYQHIAEVALL
jgi:hypothetical protein